VIGKEPQIMVQQPQSLCPVNNYQHSFFVTALAPD
jgi:hypothetical protein